MEAVAVVRDPMPRITDQQLRSEIISHLRDIADFTSSSWGPDAAQIAAWVQRPYITIRRYCDRLEAEGLIETFDGKRWLRLTEAGRRMASLLGRAN